MSKILVIIIAIIMGIISFLGLVNMDSCVPEDFSEYMRSQEDDSYPVPAEEYQEDVYSEDDILNFDIKEDADPQPDPVINDDLSSVTGTMEESPDQALYFGTLGILIPDSFEISYDSSSENETDIWGEDAETGIQFEIYGFTDPDNSAMEILEMYKDVFGKEIQDINSVPVIISYDEETETDLCLCADIREDFLYIIGFNRPNGENVGEGIFETLFQQ